MPQHTPSPGDAPLLPIGRRPPETRVRHDPEEVDASGDAVFRFALPQPPTSMELTEVYRSMLQDLAGLVILHLQGERVFFDGFAFAHEPDTVIDILPRRTARSGRDEAS